MNRRVLWPWGLVFVLLLAGSTRADEADAPAGLKERARRYKQDERDHLAATEKAEAARTEALAAVGIAGVTPLGPVGDPSRSVDVVFLGDGFTQEEMKDYEGVIERMAKNFDTPPFDAHRQRLNLYRVDLVSAESGLTRDGKTVSTRLGGTVAPFPGGKLLRCDTKEAARLARLAVPHVDYLMVVLNTHGKFLGSANSGAIVLLSTAGGHQRSIVVHEFAHNFGGLYDEYVDPKQAQGRPPPPRLKQARNVGLEPNAHAAKWHYWNVPEDVFRGRKRGKPFQVEDNVRCYEGGATFPDDVYRPEENCHMQRGRGKAFCRECTQGLELALCRFFDPVKSVSPATKTVTLTRKGEAAFEIRPAVVTAKDDETVVRWYLDGRRLPDKSAKVVAPGKGETGGARYVLEAKGSVLGEGRHHLSATVDLQTPRVRMDLGRLSASYTWTIDVGSASPTLELPEKIGGDVGTAVHFTAKTAAGGGDDAWELRHAPEGASYDPATGLVEWTPTAAQQGAWTFAFAPADGKRLLRTVPARIRPAKKRPNRVPKPVFAQPHAVRAGESLSFALLAWDPDGDHLAWSADALPAGATLDPNSGAFTWAVGPTASGTHDLVFTCTDGRKRLHVTVRVEIEGIAPFRGIFRTQPPDPALCEDWTDRMLFGLHHPLPRVRLANARALNDAPPSARLAEALRLLREKHAGLHAWAAETLEAVFDEAATAHLDMFLDAMPSQVWQYVDRPGDRALLDGLADKALSTEGIGKDHRKALEALKTDLDAIEAYGKERLERDPMPPITDKKHR